MVNLSSVTIMKWESCSVHEFNATNYFILYLQCQDEHVGQKHLSLVWERKWEKKAKSVIKTLQQVL